MSKKYQYAKQHILDHPELIDRDLLQKADEISKKEASTMKDRLSKLKELLHLLKISLPTWVNYRRQAWDILNEVLVRLRSAVIVKEKQLSPGTKVRHDDGKEYIIGKICPDYKVTLEGKRGTHSPLSVEALE